MNCPNCGNELEQDAVFCTRCGASVTSAEQSPAPAQEAEKTTVIADEPAKTTVIADEPAKTTVIADEPAKTTVLPAEPAPTTVLNGAPVPPPGVPVPPAGAPVPPAGAYAAQAAAGAPSVDQTQVYAQPAPGASSVDQTQQYAQPVPQATSYEQAVPTTPPARTQKSIGPKIAIGALAVALLGGGGMAVANLLSKGSSEPASAPAAQSQGEDAQSTAQPQDSQSDGAQDQGGDAPSVTAFGSEPVDPRCYTQDMTLTGYALMELDGEHLGALAKGLGYSWKADRKWYEMGSEDAIFYVSGDAEHEMDDQEISQLDTNSKGTPSVRVLVRKDTSYNSLDEAFKDIMNGVKYDARSLDDSFLIALAEASDGTEAFVYGYREEDAPFYVFEFFNNESVSSGLINEWAGIEFGSSVEEIYTLLVAALDSGDPSAAEELQEQEGVEEKNDAQTDSQGSSQGTTEPVSATSLPVSANGVTIQSVRLDKDWDNKDCVVVHVLFENTSNETTSYGYNFDTRVFQNGIQCSDTFLSSTEFDNRYTDIRPGKSIEIDLAFNVKDNSPIEIEIKDFYDFSSNAPIIAVETPLS